MTGIGLFEETAYETCGRAYFMKVTWEEDQNAAAYSVGGGDDPSEAANEEETTKKEHEDYEKHAKKISIADMKKDDYYKVLGLDGLKWMATEDQIRSAYRKLVLKYHPDKLTNPTPEDRQIFLRVQDAYDVLGNPEKRKAWVLIPRLMPQIRLRRRRSDRTVHRVRTGLLRLLCGRVRRLEPLQPDQACVGAACLLDIQTSPWNHRHPLGGGRCILPILARVQVVACLQRLRRIQPRGSRSSPPSPVGSRVSW